MFIDVDVIGEREVAADIHDIGERAYDMRPGLRRVRDMIVSGHRKQFSSRGGHLKTPWPPLSPATVERKGSAEVLVATGALRDSLTGGQTSVSRSAVSVGTKVEYARFAHHGTEHSPPRPLVGVADADERSARWLLERYLGHGFA